VLLFERGGDRKGGKGREGREKGLEGLMEVGD